MKKNSHYILVVLTMLTLQTTRAAAQQTDVDRLLEDYTLVWNDEFDGPSIDTDKWGYRANGSTRNYAIVDGDRTIAQDGNGHLVIRVTQENGQYYVGQLATDGRFEQTYGYFECRAKVNQYIGPHVAFWLQSNAMGNTPYDPAVNGAEVDIFEYHRKTPGEVWQTVHINGYGADHQSQGQQIPYPAVDTGFHTFGLLWTNTSYVFFVDGQKTHETSFGLSQRPEYIILSTELTGFGGDPALGQYPDSVVFDYVRVYERNSDQGQNNLDTTIVTTSADTYTYDAAGSQNSNFGSATSLVSKFGGGTALASLPAAIGYNRRTYLKFATAPISGLSEVQQVLLRMCYYNKDVVNFSKGAKVSLSRLTSWDEHSITWNTQQQQGGALDSLNAVLEDGTPKAPSVPNPLTDEYIRSYAHYMYLDITDTIRQMLASNSLPDTLSLVLEGYSIGTGTQQYNTGYTYFSKEFTNTSGATVDSLSPSLVVYSLKNQTTPVTASPISLRLEGSTVRLQWTTYTELNSQSFILERSSDGRNFIPIAEIPAKGWSQHPVVYRHLDNAPQKGNNYYRFSQIDINGTVGFVSDVAMINLKNQSAIVVVYPNPVKVGAVLHLSFTGRQNTAARVQISDLNGRVVRTVSSKTDMNTKTIQVNTSGLAAGVYIVTVFVDGRKESTKVILE